MTVAVSVSSSADAVPSAIPSLHPYNLHISILLDVGFDASRPGGLRWRHGVEMIRSTFSLSVLLRRSAHQFGDHLPRRVAWPITWHTLWIKTIWVIINSLRGRTVDHFSTGLGPSQIIPLLCKPIKQRIRKLHTIIIALILGIAMFAGITFLQLLGGCRSG